MTMAITKMRRRWAIVGGAVAAILAAVALLVSGAVGTGRAAGSGNLAAAGSSVATHHAVFVRAKVYKHGLHTKVRVRPTVHHAKAAHKPKHKGKHGAHGASAAVPGDSGTVK